jgi:hypothetical protein
MTELIVTAPSVGLKRAKGRGRPRGSGFADDDYPLLVEMRGMIESTPTIPTLRHAAKSVADRARNYRHATPDWIWRRLERRFRIIFST